MSPAFHEREDRLRVDGHLRLGTFDPVPGEELVVVLDHAVVDADDGPVPDRVVVRLDLGMPLREVADVDECLGGLRGDVELVEEGARSTAELRHTRLPGGVPAVRVADGVGAALGDSREERLGGQRPVDARVRTEAESRYAAHEPLFDSVIGRHSHGRRPP